jgi:hypothetical protein
MRAMSRLERRYRRLLAWYPAQHRRIYGEEMIGVLLASAPDGQRRPRLAESFDLVRGGLRTRLRAVRTGFLDISWRDALTVYSIALPVMMMCYQVAFDWSRFTLPVWVEVVTSNPCQCWSYRLARPS